MGDDKPQGSNGFSDISETRGGKAAESNHSVTRETEITFGSSFSRTRVPCYVVVILCLIMVVVGIGVGILIGRFAIKDNEDVAGDIEKNVRDERSGTTMPTFTNEECGGRNPDESTGNEDESSLFAPLSRAEISRVTQIMVDRGHADSSAGLIRNRITHVTLYQVEKVSALSYLDKNGTFPGRYALVHVARGAELSPDVMEYRVGPLNETNDNIKITKLRADGEVSINRRPVEYMENIYLKRIVRDHMNSIAGLLMDSFDGAYFDNGLTAQFVLIQSQNASDRVSKMYLHFSMPSLTLRLLPVTCLVHHPGTDTSTWYISDLFYLSQGPFNSGSELMSAFTSGQLRTMKLSERFRHVHYSDFDLKLNMSLPSRPHSDLPPPLTYMYQGPRYTIKGNRVSWMGWQFEFSSDALRGPAVFDVRFKGDRIAYEISLQDITLLYAKQSNGAGPSTLSDTHYYLGTYNAPRLGLDCPSQASSLSSTLYRDSRLYTNTAACIFEATAQRPLWRHRYYGLEEHYLVMRSPLNLGNYDYSLEWQFHYDGRIETVISASGLLYGAFWDPNDPLVGNDKSSTPFGFRLSDILLGPIHDHTFAFKVDLDILGTQNSVEIHHWKGGPVLDALQTQTNVTEKPEYFYLNNTRYLVHELLETEKRYVADPINPKVWTVVNEGERNIWGVQRGYRVMPHSAVGENLKDHVMLNAWDHLKCNLAFTKRKESEPYVSTSWYDLSHPYSAFGGVGKMMDNEGIRNKDLVLWVSEKFMHVPTAEDVPMTLQVHKGFTLKPFNYFDRTPTFDIKGHYGNDSPYDLTKCGRK